MTKNEKQTVINGLAEQLQQYAGFYLTDISALNAEQTANLRRKCFESDVKLEARPKPGVAPATKKPLDTLKPEIKK